MKPIHILAGLLGLASGAVALFAAKGSPLHRRSGTVFVYTMLVMSLTGAALAALRPSRAEVIAGVLTAYVVSSAMLTVRRPRRGARAIDAAAMAVALAIALSASAFGIQAAGSTSGAMDGYPAGMYFAFGTVAWLAAIGDARLLLGRGLEGGRRLARHLWRMCCGLFVAAGSFFLGQPQVFPKPLRQSGLLTLPVLVVIVLMSFWLVRVRSRRWLDAAAAPAVPIARY